MGWTNTTLFILSKKHNPKAFIVDFNEKLKKLGFMMLLDEFICFNDSRKGEEKETIYFDEKISELHRIETLVSWKGLGMLEYITPDFSFPVVINFLSWDDKSLEGFTIECNGKDSILQESEKHRKLIYKIVEFVNFKLVIGDFSDCSYQDELSNIINKSGEGNFNIMLKDE